MHIYLNATEHACLSAGDDFDLGAVHKIMNMDQKLPNNWSMLRYLKKYKDEMKKVVYKTNIAS